MRTREIAVAGVAGLLVAATVWKVVDRAPKRGAQRVIATEQQLPESAASDARATEDRLNRLQAQVGELRQQLAIEQLAKASAQVPVSPPPVESATPDRAAEQRRLEEHMQGIVADFEAESRDANWARDRTEEFQKSFARGSLLKKAVQSLDCRSTTCRVEMLDDRSADFFKELNDMVSIIGRSLPTMAGQRVTRPDGTAVAVYFFSKDS
jgi:hypothetical protein